MTHDGQPVTKKAKRVPDSCSSCSSVGSVNGPFDGSVTGPYDEMESAWGNQRLRNADRDVFEIMKKEKEWQCKGIVLVASENFVSKDVMEALGRSHLMNKYAFGNIWERDIGGSQYIDEIKTLCRKRALAAFGLNSENWGVIVHPFSCTSANFAVYAGLLKPGDKIMGFVVVSGGYKSHGSGASIFFQSLSYKVNPKTGYVDYDKLEEEALDFRPNLLICGGDSYAREWDYPRFRQIADKCGAVLLCDMSQISGLVAAKECASPFECCDIVTSTTHKSLRGLTGGIFFCRKGLKCDDTFCDFERKIDIGIHQVALAVALKQVASPEYKMYIRQVKKNAKALASELVRRKCRIITGGTDNHLVLWDLRGFGDIGFFFEKVCEMCRITLSILAPYNHKCGWYSGAVCIGAAAMTSKGCVESDFKTIAILLVQAALSDAGTVPCAS